MSELLSTPSDTEEIIDPLESLALELHTNILDWLTAAGKPLRQPSEEEGVQTLELIPQEVVQDIWSIDKFGLVVHPDANAAYSDALAGVQVIQEGVGSDEIEQFDIFYIDGKYLILKSSFGLDHQTGRRTDYTVNNEPDGALLAEKDEIKLLIAWLESSRPRPSEV